jgi:hypothetical protein
MPQYLCECCSYETNIKSKLQQHFKTKKHLKNDMNDTDSIDSTNPDLIIEELQKQIMYHKGQNNALEKLIEKLIEKVIEKKQENI